MTKSSRGRGPRNDPPRRPGRGGSSGAGGAAGRAGSSGAGGAAGGGGAGRPRRRGFDPDKPFQVGRRPSSPWLLFVVGLLWVGVGLVMLFELTAVWRIVPAVFAAGVGLYFIRGASATVLRRDRRRPGS